MKDHKRRTPTPQISVKCTKCNRTAIRYEYGYRKRIRWAKSGSRPKPMGSCYLCGGPVEPHEFPRG